MYVGEDGRYAHDNRAILEKRLVHRLPAQAAALLDGALAAGSYSAAPEEVAGYRWQDKGGDWAEYDVLGRLVGHGDRNGNVVWLARDGEGVLRGVVEGGTGQVLWRLMFTRAEN